MRAAILALALAGCATSPPPPAPEIAPVVVSAPEPVDTRIRETTMPAIIPYAVMEPDGETRGYRIQWPDGVRCAAVGGALSCDWGRR